jgi:fumarate reductase subunit D
MTVVDRVASPADRSSITKMSLAGAICYALWGGLHLQAAYAVYHVGVALEPGMARGRVFQDAWNLLFFGVTAIVVALILNIRNNAWGYWINLGVLALADTGLIFSY